jgi:uncharacterized protein YcbX
MTLFFSYIFIDFVHIYLFIFKDNWTKFSIGKSQFSKIKQCTRCLLTTINPDTGIKCKDHEPFKTLKTYRCLDIKLYGYLPMFGINVSLVNNNDNTDYFISVGDKILE